MRSFSTRREPSFSAETRPTRTSIAPFAKQGVRWRRNKYSQKDLTYPTPAGLIHRSGGNTGAVDRVMGQRLRTFFCTDRIRMGRNIFPIHPKGESPRRAKRPTTINHQQNAPLTPLIRAAPSMQSTGVESECGSMSLALPPIARWRIHGL